MNKRFFFELSGEHPLMPSAEARMCIQAEAGSPTSFSSGPGYVISEFDENALNGISERIALTHHVGPYLGSFDLTGVGSIDTDLPTGTFAIRAKRFKGMSPEISTQHIVRKLGAELSRSNDVDLNDPDIEIRVHVSDRIHVYIAERSIDRDILESRKVGERPFFSPISLHPRYARAAINLTGVKRGGTVLDPFCGTGGIAIEAAFMGMRTIVTDFDDVMIDGCIENMEYYGLKPHDHGVMDIGDVPDHFHNIDSVVTDPPYGRSTCTGGENIDRIYNRTITSISKVLSSSGSACVVLPYTVRTDELAVTDVLVQKVHGSLSRHYHVLKKL